MFLINTTKLSKIILGIFIECKIKNFFNTNVGTSKNILRNVTKLSLPPFKTIRLDYKRLLSKAEVKARMLK